MKDNKLTIKIKKPLAKTFAFPLDPKNTPLWIDSIVEEKTNEWPVKVGSIYRNKNKKGRWSEYALVALEKNKMFELVSKDKNYHVRYTCKPINDNTTELEYYEWVERGALEKPFTIDILEKLKFVIENRGE